MLTGSNSRADVDRAREAGASGYVTKDRIASELIERDRRDRDARRAGYPDARDSAFLAVVQVLIVFVLVALILMHSRPRRGHGRAWASRPASQGGTHIVERNLTRFTVVVGVLFFANSIALFHYLKYLAAAGATMRGLSRWWRNW